MFVARVQAILAVVLVADDLPGGLRGSPPVAPMWYVVRLALPPQFLDSLGALRTRSVSFHPESPLKGADRRTPIGRGGGRRL
ncbi:hypothetical protein E2C01_016623 [Portunus trituberculatus]|uniref:Secreted protein n=1 Tax=Portunus trituberculatus TaxID=210409 RepID=A0A5B7DRL5_PORTR|nr:hypothetical protein [Portunus trituberculatus]